MKNIIWQTPGGGLAVRNLRIDDDSQAMAAELLVSGQVDASWTPVLFDVQEFPGPPQETWVIVDGVLTADESARNAWLIAQTKQYARGLRSQLFELADGLQASYLALGSTVNAVALEAYKEGLRNITLTDLTGANTEAEMKGIVSAAYKALKDALPLAVKIKFHQTLQ